MADGGPLTTEADADLEKFIVELKTKSVTC
jgi:hypothetical protein